MILFTVNNGLKMSVPDTKLLYNGVFESFLEDQEPLPIALKHMTKMSLFIFYGRRHPTGLEQHEGK